MRSKAFFAILSAVMLISEVTTAQPRSPRVEALDSLMQIQSKPILFLLTAPWCLYCKMQQAQLSKNKNFQQSTKNFYYTPFNVEAQQEISFNRRSYRSSYNGAQAGTHELATFLNGQQPLRLPTWVLLNKNYEIIFRHQGFLARKQVDSLSKLISQMPLSAKEN